MDHGYKGKKACLGWAVEKDNTDALDIAWNLGWGIHERLINIAVDYNSTKVLIWMHQHGFEIDESYIKRNCGVDVKRCINQIIHRIYV